MPDQVKDFYYYADAAVRVIAGINEAMSTSDIEAMAAVASVYASLATAAPKQAEQRFEVHHASCPCLPRGDGD